MAVAAAVDAQQVRPWVPGVPPGVEATCQPLQLDFTALPKWPQIRSNVERHDPPIAHGAYGTVYRGRLHNRTVVYKSMILTDPEEEAMAATEIRLLRLLGNHDRIVQMEAAYYEPERQSQAGVYKRIMLVLESCCMTLRSLTTSWGKVSESWHIMVLQQVLEGLQRLQLAYVIHRDLHACNILISSCSDTPGQFQAKIADFGCSVMVQKTGEHPRQHLWQRAKRNYTHYSVASPEVLQHYVYSFGADSWAVGVLALELVQDRPWLTLPQQPEVPNRSHEVSVLKIVTSALRALPQLLVGLQGDSAILGSGISVAMIAELMLLNPLERPTAENALQLLAGTSKLSATAPVLPVQDARRRRLRSKRSFEDSTLPTPWSRPLSEQEAKHSPVIRNSRAACSSKQPGNTPAPRVHTGRLQERHI